MQDDSDSTAQNATKPSGNFEKAERDRASAERKKKPEGKDKTKVQPQE